MAGDLSERVALIRQKTDLPLVVGFGISSPEQVSEVAKVADGVVVGSALVNCIPQNLDNHTVMLSAIKEKSQRLVGGLKVR